MNKSFASTIGLGMMMALAQQGCAQTSEREKLIRALVEDGDKLWASNNAATKLNGKLAWSFAEKYSPNDRGIQERVKRGVDSKEYERDKPNEDVSKLTSDIVRSISLEEADFSPQTPQLDLVNLRMLLDKNSVGSREAFGVSFSRNGTQVAVSIFLRKPSYSLKDVRSKFGPPSAEQSDGRQVVLVYGRFVVFSKPAGEVLAVAFKPFE